MKKYLMMAVIFVATSLYAADAGMPKSGEFVWNELATTDVKAAKDFYAKVFGWEFDEMKMDNMTYTLVKKGGKEFAGIWAIPADQQFPSHWIPYILVDNVEEGLEKVRQSGGTVIKPVQKVGDMGLFAIVKDPTGAHFALWQMLQK